jgi:hypothetical protein
MRKARLCHSAEFRLVLTAVFLLVIAGCRRGSAKLEGRWKGVRAEGVDPSAQIRAESFATSTEIVAIGDKIAIQTPNGRSPTSTYTVEREDATTLVIHTDRDPSAETFTFNEKGDTMVWRIDETRRIWFKKVPPEGR